MLNRLPRFSVLPALSLDGIIHCDIIEGSFCAGTFYWFIKGLLQSMQPFPGVTGTRDWLVCMPVDWGKSWEPAHTFLDLASPCTVSSQSYLITCVCCCFADKGCRPLCTSSASRLVSCPAIVVCSQTFCYY